MEQELLDYIRAHPDQDSRQISDGLGRPGVIAFNNALRKLRQDGLVTKTQVEDENGHVKNLYRALPA